MIAAFLGGPRKVRRPEHLHKIDIEVNVSDAVLLATDDEILTALDSRHKIFKVVNRRFE
jgi:hypothetical protein